MYSFCQLSQPAVPELGLELYSHRTTRMLHLQSADTLPPVLDSFDVHAAVQPTMAEKFAAQEPYFAQCGAGHCRLWHL